MKGPYFWSFDPSIALKLLKLKLSWVKTVWKKFCKLFFAYNVGDQIKHTKLNKKHRNYLPFTKFCYGQVNTYLQAWLKTTFTRFFCVNLRTWGAHVQAYTCIYESFSKKGGLIWPHIANVGSKSLYGKTSVLKFAARPFFYFFTTKTEFDFYVS